MPYLLTEDAVCLMHEHAQSQGPQLCKIEAAFVAAKVTRAAAESNIPSITASKFVSRGKVAQSTLCVEELGNEVSGLRQEGVCRVEHVHF